MERRPWSTILRTVLAGIHTRQSSLHILRAQPIVLRLIWAYLQDLWRPHIRRKELPEELPDGWLEYDSCRIYDADFAFPPPRDLNLNMMPFVLGHKGSLPAYCHAYWDLIRCCRHIALAPEDQVCYLTVHESLVQEGPQRRGGVHTESPGLLVADACEIQACWGGDGPMGGIFMMSTVSDSTAVWPVLIHDHAQVVGEHGDLEHVRGLLGPRRLLQATELLWLTDRTPHESLPVAPGTYRQFFRLVMADVTVWYEDHSTSSPCGVEPGPTTAILSGNKFSGDLRIKRPAQKI